MTPYCLPSPQLHLHIIPHLTSVQAPFRTCTQHVFVNELPLVLLQEEMVPVIADFIVHDPGSQTLDMVGGFRGPCREKDLGMTSTSEPISNSGSFTFVHVRGRVMSGGVCS